MSVPSRKSPRLSGYDYQTSNYYFLTICTHHHKCIFGTPGELNHLGRIAANDLMNIPAIHPGVKIDKFVVMPNHIHVIMVISNPADCPSIPQMIASYKTGVTKQIRSICPGLTVWQRSFYDHIIRNEADYQSIWQYVSGNPSKWLEDQFYVKNSV